MVLLQIQTLTETVRKFSSQKPTIQNHNFSLWELINEGGMASNLIVSIIFFLFLISLYIFFERLFFIQALTYKNLHFMDHIQDMIHEGKFEAAIEYCQNNPVPEAKIIEKGLERIGRPLNDITQTMENTAKLEIYRLERGIRTLAMIAGSAPMLGFLGTVTGMIMAFYQIAQTATQVNPQALAAGIYTAMNTTAVGLVAGICAYIFYNLLVIKIDKASHRMETVATHFLDIISKPIS